MKKSDKLIKWVFADERRDMAAQRLARLREEKAKKMEASKK